MRSGSGVGRCREARSVLSDSRQCRVRNVKEADSRVFYTLFALAQYMQASEQNARTEWLPAPREALTYATSQGVPGPAASSVSCRASVFRRTRVQNFD
ncbi:hypothetical protein MES4922_410005 [Mesorhizobium ventifaucium]|uniref:Uncharacterized protein n=1 Tax=Mesorhizobium ventifaucium TaxID=666020 RepID=A0ABN8K6L6_9HYPH|nr:hypothetical protein MES4922_410005 [Mesorhizobium ventifaucium]